MPIKSISKERFNALCRVKHVAADYISGEKEWYADEDERVLGIVLIDLQDKDWAWMILGRDEAGLFRAIDLKCCVSTQNEARELLKTKLIEYSNKGQKVFPQGDVKRDSIDLFKPIVAGSLLHPNFRILAESEHHSSAREILKELAQAFVDVDGNFVKDFQTTGFNARLWELYLNAFLYEQRFGVDRSFDRPDFCTEKEGLPIGIEAVTVNPTIGEIPPNPTNDNELRDVRQEYMPIKYGSALFSKLQKRYWELPHMQGKPFILAVHDFCANDSMTWSAPALNDYLFGLRASWRKDVAGTLHITENPIPNHRWGNKTIPSGFFNQPDAKYVSAVLFSNSATLSKFNRVGKLAGFGNPSIKMFRIGVKHDFDPDATEPIPFRVDVEPDKYSETWTEGIQIFHNPHALLPLPPFLFNGCADHFLKDGRRIQMLPDWFVHSSHTLIVAPTDVNSNSRKPE